MNGCMRAPAVCLLVLATSASSVAAWAGPGPKVFPLSSNKPMPAELTGTPERLTRAVAIMIGGTVSDSSITGAALALGCDVDDATCLDQIARTNRVGELVFGTIRVSDDLRVFVKLTRHIAGTARRERTFVLTAETPKELGKALVRASRELFELEGEPEPEVEPASPRSKAGLGTSRRKQPVEVEGTEKEETEEGEPAGNPLLGPTETPAETERPAERRTERRSGETAPRGRVTLGTYGLIGSGLAVTAIGGGFWLAACSFPEPSREFACKVTMDCSDGRTCELGYCVLPSSGVDASGGGGDGGPRDAAPDADPNAQLAAQCMAAGYTLDATTNGYYRRSTMNENWLDAQALCAADVPGKTHLVVLSVQAEVDFMKARPGWIGLSDRAVENSFVPVTAEAATLKPFDSGQPDNGGGGGEDCVQIRTNGKLDDDQCDNDHPYVCECDGRAPVP